MSNVPFFNEPLSQDEHDNLWAWAQSCYALNDTWQTLWLNNLPLGRLNTYWKELLQHDWDGQITECSDGIHLTTNDWLSMGDCLQHIAFAWKQIGVLQGWRDEKFDVTDSNGNPLFCLERAAFRPLGLLSHAVHLNGLSCVNGEWHFWIGRRSAHKAVDPNKLDNMVGGGIASGERILEAMIRESEEEAGLPNYLTENLSRQNQLHSLRPVTRGLHNEILHIFDLILPPDILPENQDGEVAEFVLKSIPQLLEEMFAENMMSDAQLVTLDAFLRYGLLNPNHPLTHWLQEIKINDSLTRVI